MKSFYNKHRGNIKNLTLYGLYGSVGALTDFIVFTLIYNLFDIDPIISTILSTSLGICVSFMLNHFLNFKKNNYLWYRFFLFGLVGACGIILGALIIHVLHNFAGINANIAKIVSIPFVVSAQFIINRRFSFSDNPKQYYVNMLRLFKNNYSDIIIVFLSFLIFFLAATGGYSNGDDIDNLLGGKLIWQGQWPYSGFFSHHMPGAYLVSALIYPISLNNLFWFQILFNVLSFSLLIATFVHIRRVLGKLTAWILIICVSLGHVLALGPATSAEHLITFILLYAYSVLIFSAKINTLRQFTILALLIGSVPLLSLVYILPCLPAYVLLIIKSWNLISKTPKRKLKRFLLLVAIALLPYVLLLIYLLLTRSLSTFTYNLFEFNQTYYAPFSNDPNGNIFKIMASIVIKSVDQIYMVIINIFNATYSFQSALVIFILLFLAYLASTKRYIELIATLAGVLLFNNRVNAYHQPAITSSPYILSHHAQLYIIMAIAFGSIAIGVLFSKSFKNTFNKDRHLLNVYSLSAIYAFTVIFISLSHFWLTRINDIYVNKTNSLYSLSQSAPKEPLVSLINSLTTENDKVWLAPNLFREQLYLKPQTATSYTFYYPWIDTSPVTRQKLVSELKTEKPVIIVWFNLDSNYTMSQEFRSVLKDDYFQLNDERLRTYYFIRSSEQRFITDLSRRGFDVNQK